MIVGALIGTGLVVAASATSYLRRHALPALRTPAERLRRLNPALSVDGTSWRAVGRRAAPKLVRAHDALVVVRRRLVATVVTTVSALTLVAVPAPSSRPTTGTTVAAARRV
jgi:hypothetical protein